ncbi:hypothetical protein LEMLEM_LOCUS9796 [Lemmus lemmus]
MSTPPSLAEFGSRSFSSSAYSSLARQPSLCGVMSSLISYVTPSSQVARMSATMRLFPSLISASGSCRSSSSPPHR